MPLVWSNLKTIAGNLGHSLLQDNALLRNAAVPLLACFQVSARCLISTQSAKHALRENDSDALYVEREAAKTCFRELGGGFLTFGVIKSVQVGGENLVDSLFNGRWSKPDSIGPLSAMSQSLKALTGQLKSPVQPMRNAVSGAIHYQAGAGGFRFQGLLAPLGRLGQSSQALAQLSSSELALKGFQALRDWGPLSVATGMAVFLSGWKLERLSLKHSEKIVSFLTGKPLPAEGKEGDAPASALPKSPAYSGASTLAARDLVELPRGQSNSVTPALPSLSSGAAVPAQALPSFQSPVLQANRPLAPTRFRALGYNARPALYPSFR